VSELRSALVVEVPAAAPVVDRWRERTCADRPSIGVPAHVTILFPFVPARTIDDAVLSGLRELYSAFAPFAFEFREARRFPDVLYLAPEPSEPFLQLIFATATAYPDCPPYDGEIPLDSIVPHLTVAHGDALLLEKADAEVQPRLPIHAKANEVLLIEEAKPDWGRWQERARIPFDRAAK
jgi:2'-5' RNA ligase